MKASEFLIALTLGAGALALWINVRFPRIAPGELRTAIIHVGAALLVGQALVPLVHASLPDMSAVVQALIMTFLIGLPALVYSLLSSIWIIRLAQAAIRR
jgi:hypothetical protein